VPNKRIGVSHMTNADQAEGPIIIGQSAEQICHTIFNHYPWVSQRHAAYLGRELQKAELALKWSIGYTQDSELPIAMVVDQDPGHMDKLD